MRVSKYLMLLFPWRAGLAGALAVDALDALRDSAEREKHMPDYLVTYDLRVTNPDPHSEFIAQAEARGWAAFKLGPQSKQWLRLPNTTLVGQFDNLDAAHGAFNATKPATEAALGVAITVEKYILVAYGACSFNSGDRQAS